MRVIGIPNDRWLIKNGWQSTYIYYPKRSISGKNIGLFEGVSFKNGEKFGTFSGFDSIEQILKSMQESHYGDIVIIVLGDE